MKRINLALQGGGAHGAFTWGVLDRLLQDDGIEIAAISATSAGALNAAALKSGWVRDGRAGARENLDWLWGQVGAVTDARLTDWVSSMAPAAHVVAQAMKYSPAYAALDMTSRMMSPYVTGPLMRNPLEKIVKQFHYDAVCGQVGPALHICTTNVRSGKIRVFSGDEISSDVIMASACLPTMFQAVEFTDPRTGRSEAFWDGGYSGNPALFPLFAKDCQMIFWWSTSTRFTVRNCRLMCRRSRTGSTRSVSIRRCCVNCAPLPLSNACWPMGR